MPLDSPRALPFYDPEGELIHMQGGHSWTLTDALAGCLTTGRIGSGKSSGPMAMQRRAFLRSTPALPGGCGGMVFFAKNGEADEWEQMCQRLGRSQDVIRVTPGGRYKFNFLDWIAQWGAGDERSPIPTVALLEEIASAVDKTSSGAGKGDNAFFEGAHRTKLTNLVHICQLAGLPVSLPLMRAVSSGGPQTIEQGNDPAWRERNVCYAILREAEAKTRSDPAAAKDYEECRKYFMLDYPMLSDRTRGVIEIMFTNLVRPFLTRPLRPIFCEESNIRPEMMFDGKIFLIDIAVQEFHQTAKLAAIAFKRTAQLAIMRRSGPPGSLRPVFIVMDEAQNFLSPKDTEYQAVARSAGGITCIATQQISSIREAMGSADRCENLVSNLSTKFFCANAGETARYASELLGARYSDILGKNIGGHSPSNPDDGGSGSNSGVSVAEQKREYLQASRLQTLRTGGKANNYTVDTVVFAGGRTLSYDKKGEPLPYKILPFPQRD